jgi:hypothetical protein
VLVLAREHAESVKRVADLVAKRVSSREKE